MVHVLEFYFISVKTATPIFVQFIYTCSVIFHSQPLFVFCFKCDFYIDHVAESVFNIWSDNLF